MESLVSLDLTLKGIHLTDKEYSHGYLSYYERLFVPYRYRPVNIFEVGYWFGGSCKLWNEYFEYPKIRAIDIRTPKNKYHPSPFLTVYEKPRGNVQLSLIDIRNLSPMFFSDFPVDIAIDDGSHLIWDQLTFFKLVWPFVKEGGMLIIEDIQDWDQDKHHFNELNVPYVMYDLRDGHSSDSIFLLFRK